ncbi:flagellar hook protein E [Stappia aggregata IAM 12614]|uniref:Flagellar hook protein E n=1 Tax=Roseibium aggregatum (strain ATCC 25650 / DSM 13394 / JCM 20685 / NBRC 16684 / NCIMB 2208 / IAM 12614 / B1) TaxID=384765 RepID=A0NT18_ROSAI|nr:flagellar hook protein E [Stappia aggregata IAM 12614] [Roseibium aggregatum IAM 12614]
MFRETTEDSVCLAASADWATLRATDKLMTITFRLAGKPR